MQQVIDDEGEKQRSGDGRQPRADELAPTMDLLNKQRTNLGNRPAAAAELCRGLMNLNEFLYID